MSVAPRYRPLAFGVTEAELRDVHGAGGHGIDGAAQRFGARCAEVLDARDRHVRQAQRHRQGQARTAHALVLVEDAEPGRVDPVALDAGILPHTLGADMHGYNTAVPAPPSPGSEKLR